MTSRLRFPHHRQQRGYLPNFTTIRQRFNSGGQRLLVHIPSPHTVDTCTTVALLRWWRIGRL